MNRQETLDCLDREGIGYELTEHKAVYNMAELAEVDLPYPHLDAKNLFVRDDKRLNYYLITVRGEKRVNLKDFRRQHAKNGHLRWEVEFLLLFEGNAKIVRFEGDCLISNDRVNSVWIDALGALAEFDVET